jgi:hypothetical protein
VRATLQRLKQDQFLNVAAGPQPVSGSDQVKIFQYQGGRRYRRVLDRHGIPQMFAMFQMKSLQAAIPIRRGEQGLAARL